jgi:hypothetical protein
MGVDTFEYIVITYHKIDRTTLPVIRYFDTSYYNLKVLPG